MIRIAIDQDGDGSFALVTRPGAPAERIPITHRDAVRLMSEAAQAVQAEECNWRAQLGATPHWTSSVRGGEEGAVERQEGSMACRQEPDIGLISYETMSSNRRLEPPAAPQVQIKGIIPLRQVKE